MCNLKRSLTKTELSTVFDNSSTSVEFFVDGDFNFPDQNWKNGEQIIDESKWIQSEDFTYPILLDRIAYVRSKTSSMIGVAKDIGMDTKYTIDSKGYSQIGSLIPLKH